VKQMKNDTIDDAELVQLSEILDTVKKDALEVADLIVTGIDYYRLLAFVCLGLGALFTGYILSQINLIGVLNIAIGFFMVALIWACAALCFYKNRQLKKKYQELIEIKKSLTEE
jgi:hypothetical protein